MQTSINNTDMSKRFNNENEFKERAEEAKQDMLKYTQSERNLYPTDP